MPPTEPPAETRSLSAADSAWWHMEEPTNQMVITGVMTFAQPLHLSRLRTVLSTKLLQFDRFRQRIVEPEGPLELPRWVEDATLSLDYHLQCVQLPAPADRRTLQSLVGELMSQPLDYARPLWQFHYVENYREGSALVVRLHHAIADGIALINLLLTLDDIPGNEGQPIPTGSSGRPLDESAGGGSGGLLRGVLGLPGRLISGTLASSAAALSLARLAAMGADPATALRGALSQQKKAAWSEPFALADLKEVGHHLGATVHDVLASVVAGALRHYLLLRGGLEMGISVRAVVPVNLRRAEDVESLGNKFGLVFLSLPLGLGDPVERLHAVKRNMDRLKDSPEAMVVFGLLNVFGRAAKGILSMVVNFLGKNASLVMTNVPGPREPIWFCGAQLQGLMAWVPQSGRLALGVSILSYAGHVRVGVAADARLVPDPEAIVEGCQKAMRELLEHARARIRGATHA